MKRRLLSIIILTLLLAGSVMQIYYVQLVRAQTTGTVYIRGDGSVDPPGAPVQRNGNVYTLTGNITNTALNATIIVERDGVVLDGAGFTINGQPSSEREKRSVGVLLNGRSNVTIQNMQFNGPEIGVLLNASYNNHISGNTLMHIENGILLDSCMENSINGNTMTDIGESINLFLSYNNTIQGNVQTHCGLIRLNSSSYNSIVRNRITDGYGGVRFDFYSSYNRLEENIIASASLGISLFESSGYNTIRGNNITNNSLGGIMFDSTSKYNSIFENVIENNTVGVVPNYRLLNEQNVANGVPLLGSSNNISGNMFYHNNIITNGQQVDSSSYTSDYADVWDGGYAVGGNFWSDYTGTDANHDGIGDTPYVIDAHNIDHYPLVAQYAVPEVPYFLVAPLFFALTLLSFTIRKKYAQTFDRQSDRQTLGTQVHGKRERSSSYSFS
jgi:parallel beta-helix repeat protein